MDDRKLTSDFVTDGEGWWTTFSAEVLSDELLAQFSGLSDYVKDNQANSVINIFYDNENKPQIAIYGTDDGMDRCSIDKIVENGKPETEAISAKYTDIIIAFLEDNKEGSAKETTDSPIIIEGLEEKLEYFKIKKFIEKIDMYRLGKGEFTSADVERLLSLFMEVNSNPDTKHLLYQDFLNPVTMKEVDEYGNLVGKNIYSRNLFDRMNTVKPNIAEYFGCKPEEIGIVMSNNVLGQVNDARLLSGIGSEHETEEIPYSVLIGDFSFGNKAEESAPKEKVLPASNVILILGDADFRDYQGPLSKNLCVTGNVLTDDKTQVSAIDTLYYGESADSFEEVVQGNSNTTVKTDKLEDKSIENIRAFMRDNYKEKPDKNYYTAKDIGEAATVEGHRDEVLDVLATNSLGEALQRLGIVFFKDTKENSVDEYPEGPDAH